MKAQSKCNIAFQGILVIVRTEMVYVVVCNFVLSWKIYSNDKAS